jgi:predicted kinase
MINNEKIIIKSSQKDLIILRGIPGSGKSTFAQFLGTKAICCTDDYITRNGVYCWKPETIDISHEWCKRKCRRFMEKNINRIVIANTNTTEKEMQPYVDLAQQFSYKIYFIIVENRHDGINIHNVPEETLNKMKNRFSIHL